MVKCELCNTFTLQFNNHIKRRHPGCGQSAARKGYDSTGSYVDVWFKGECGSNFPFYLLCSSCREKYLAANLNDPSSKYERCVENTRIDEHMHTSHDIQQASRLSLSCILLSSFCTRIKGLTSDLIGQLDSTSDGRKGPRGGWIIESFTVILQWYEQKFSFLRWLGNKSPRWLWHRQADRTGGLWAFAEATWADWKEAGARPNSLHWAGSSRSPSLQLFWHYESCSTERYSDFIQQVLSFTGCLLSVQMVIVTGDMCFYYLPFFHQEMSLLSRRPSWALDSRLFHSETLTIG